MDITKPTSGLWNMNSPVTYGGNDKDHDGNFNLYGPVSAFDVYKAELGAENFENVTSFLEEQAMLLDTRLDFIAIEVIKPFLDELPDGSKTNLKTGILQLFDTIEDTDKNGQKRSRKLIELRGEAEETYDINRMLENLALGYRFASDLDLRQNVFLLVDNILNLYFTNHPKGDSWNHSDVAQDFWNLILVKRNEKFVELHNARRAELKNKGENMPENEEKRWQYRLNATNQIAKFLSSKKTQGFNETSELIIKLINHSFNETFERNLRLVIYTVRKIMKSSDVEFGEIVQAGNLGLLKVISRIDPREKIKLGSYAISYIAREAIEGIRISKYPISLPQNFTSSFLKRYRNKLHLLEQETQETNLDPKVIIGEISQDMGQEFLSDYHKKRSIRKISNYLLLTKILSLDDYLPNSSSGFNIESEGSDVYGEPQTLGDEIPHPDSVQKLDDVIAATLLSAIIDAYIKIPDFNSLLALNTNLPLDLLSDRERYVLTFKYGLTGIEKDLQDIAYDLGLVNTRKIKKIEEEALRKIRESVLMPVFLNILQDASSIDDQLSNFENITDSKTLIPGVKIP